MEEPVGARPSVVIVGAGFGGLRVARGLSRAPVDVTILDRHNYHTFVPLLYQVATAGLEPEEIAQPIRRILRGVPNLRFRLNTVTGVDLDRRAVITDAGEVRYDYLVLAAGSTTSYFGLDSLAQVTSALRDLDDAERLRDQVLGAFGPIPTTGFFCNGEIGPVGEQNFLHGFTASIALVIPEEPSQGQVP